MDINYEELKLKAKAASPGPWEAINDTVENDDCQMIAHVMTSKYSATYKPDGSIEHIGDAVDAEFIAAFDPSVALELIERLERTQKGAADFASQMYFEALANASQYIRDNLKNGDVYADAIFQLPIPKINSVEFL